MQKRRRLDEVLGKSIMSYLCSNGSNDQQECIPVGCIPPAAVAVPGVSTRHPQADTPLEQPPWEQTPPLLTESQMPVKIETCPNFVAGGNRRFPFRNWFLYDLFTLHRTGTGAVQVTELTQISNNGSWSLSMSWTQSRSLSHSRSWSRAVWIHPYTYSIESKGDCAGRGGGGGGGGRCGLCRRGADRRVVRRFSRRYRGVTWWWFSLNRWISTCKELSTI